jgi:DNA topoisomerase-1
MSNAQRLYEGIDIGDEGTVGLITYMRTDSVNVAAEAQAEARELIAATYGDAYLPAKPPTYKTRARKAQEAHEAIRPTSVKRTPGRMKPHLSRDEHRLYRLIWQRFVASQIKPAIYDTISVDVMAGPADPPLDLPVGEVLPRKTLRALTKSWRYLFRAAGSTLRFPGFLRVYGDTAEDAEEEREVPKLQVGQWLDLLALLPEQHFTQPPPRYSESTLVRALEEHGIGRPSTYAPTIGTLQTRGYVQREGRQLQPTDIGITVNDLLVEHFPNVLDYEFTAKMEEDLDRIADGDEDWVHVLREFYGPFAETVAQAEKAMPEQKVEPEEAGIDCPKCGAPMLIKWGKYGKFLGCSRFPDCRETMPYMEKVGVKCPECGGDLVERRTRKGRTFYGCSNYPDCEFATWRRPVKIPCPECGGLMTDRGRSGIKCETCGHEMPRPEEDA